MKTTRRYGMTAIALFVALAIAVPEVAHAVGTAAGTPISNQASVDFKVGGVDQTTVTSVAASFTVDKKVDLTVAAGAGSTVFANQTSAPLVFTVTNTGNASYLYQLSAAENTDANNILAVQADIWWDKNADGVQDAGDMLYADENTFGTFSANETFQVLVTGDIAGTALDTQFATVDFTANTYSAAATEAVNGGVAGSGNAIVLADAGTDGAETATNTYTVAGVTLSITKSQALIDDSQGGTVAYAPLGTVEYTVLITQTGGTSTPTAVTLTDDIDVTNLNFLTGQYNAGADDVQIDAYDDTTTVTTTTYASGVFASPTVTVTCPAAALDEVNDSCTIKFRVQIK